MEDEVAASKLPDNPKKGTSVMETASQGSCYPDGPSSVTRALAAFNACVGAGRPMGDRTLFPCPVHGDTVPTVTVRFNPVSRLVDIGCTVGCNPAEILDAVGLSLADLASDDSSNSLLNNEFPVPVRSAPAAGASTHISALRGSASAKSSTTALRPPRDCASGIQPHRVGPTAISARRCTGCPTSPPQSMPQSRFGWSATKLRHT